ncbi:MAG: mechanosensitive ion channel [Woeseiaceae bacterium]|nr:mechanosensitive ion channel [Woeseiaceae bacterium]
MKVLRNLCLAVVVLLAFGTHEVAAQEADEAAAPETPVLESLGSNWWAYFAGTPEDVKQRADGFVETLSTQVPDLAAANQDIARSVLAALTDNLDAYVALLDDPVLGLRELPAPAVSYSLDELLEHASRAREARAGAEQERIEVERERRILNGATRRRDQAFKDYVAAEDGDERWLAGLRLVQVRAAQAIASRRLELLTQSYEQAEAYARSAAERVNEARERLEATDADAEYTTLVEDLRAAVRAVSEAQEMLREAEIAATGLDLDTPGGRAQQRLQQQRTIDAEVELAQAEVALGQVQARRWWTALQMGSVTDLDLLQAEALEWSELGRRVEQSLPQWQRESREELIAVQTVSRDGLNRAARRLLDQRVGTAQETLGHLSGLSASVEDLQLLSLVVDDAVADAAGAVSSWWGGLKRKVQGAYLRVSGLADVSLFSVGETPVTGNDVMRVVLILLVAWLLSRGVRLAFRRMSQRESASMQASMYTVGRLTHYTIIILAVFIALSSIGLDFSNLALVAGALSVGIGFGLQSIVSNFVSGLIILFEHTLRVGDYIELDTGLTGTVKSINVRSTLINTNDNIDIVVPNSEFVTTRLTNWTLGERILRVRIPFGVAYGSDKDLVKKAAIEAADEVPYTLTHMKGREPDVWLVEYGDNSLNFLLLVWVNRQGARRPTRTRAAYLWALETKLSEYGIEIPFPQRDLHLRSGWPGEKPPDVEPIEEDSTLSPESE